MCLCRSLAVQTFGIYSAKEKKSYCYYWNEYTGHRTADVTISVLYRHLASMENRKRFLIVWADNCCAQNKCWALMMFYSQLVIGTCL